MCSLRDGQHEDAWLCFVTAYSHRLALYSLITTMADDEYEQERQENIRRNRELLLSLGLNVSLAHARLAA